MTKGGQRQQRFYDPKRISVGTIAILDEAGRLALTGHTAAEMIASLNRDTADTLNALTNTQRLIFCNDRSARKF